LTGIRAVKSNAPICTQSLETRRQLRASRPNEIWHIDTTLIRLLDGSRACLHAVIDNFSRRILAWKVTATFDAGATAEILLSGAKGVDHGTPTVLVSRFPHSAFHGQTPDEMYFKNGDAIPEELEAARQEARQARAEANRKQNCENCGLVPASPN